MTKADRSWLYVGDVWHKRWRPKQHAFRYPVFYLMLDLDEFDNPANLPWCLSLNGKNIFSVHQRDYGAFTKGGLRHHVEEQLRHHSDIARPARIMMLTMPRIFGYCFNPLTTFYCYGADGQISAILYEVHNTFGEAHTYVCPVTAAEDRVAPHESEKVFHVSPFFPVKGRYRFRQCLPSEQLSLTIRYDEGGEKAMTACLTAKKKPLTAVMLVRLLLAVPFVTLKVTAAIHFEALRLWAKRLKLYRKPPPPERAASLGRLSRKQTNSEA